AFTRRMENLDICSAGGGEALPAVNLTDGNACMDHRVAQLLYRRRQTLEHHRRDIHSANTESLEQAGDGVEMVGVGGREDDRVEVNEAGGRKDGGNRPHSGER